MGKFCRFTQNPHIYDRHIPAAEEILNRTPLDIQPYIVLKDYGKNFYEYTIDDFEIHNITGIKKLNSTLELAI